MAMQARIVQLFQVAVGLQAGYCGEVHHKVDRQVELFQRFAACIQARDMMEIEQTEGDSVSYQPSLPPEQCC